MGDLMCVLHNTCKVGVNGKIRFRAIEFVKASGKRASFEFIRYSSSVFLRCLKETGMLKSFSYKYIPRVIQLHPVARVKKMKTKKGVTMYELFLNGVTWQYCVSNGQVHYHRWELEDALIDFNFIDAMNEKNFLI